MSPLRRWKPGALSLRTRARPGASWSIAWTTLRLRVRERRTLPVYVASMPQLRRDGGAGRCWVSGAIWRVVPGLPGEVMNHV